jgi:hypothetical protein
MPSWQTIAGFMISALALNLTPGPPSCLFCCAASARAGARLSYRSSGWRPLRSLFKANFALRVLKMVLAAISSVFLVSNFLRS